MVSRSIVPSATISAIAVTIEAVRRPVGGPGPASASPARDSGQASIGSTLDATRAENIVPKRRIPGIARPRADSLSWAVRATARRMAGFVAAVSLISAFTYLSNQTIAPGASRHADRG